MFEVTQEAIDQRNAAAAKAAAPPVRVLASLRQTGEGAALGSSYREHACATAVVQEVTDAAGPSGERNLAQFGARRPSGNPAVIAGQQEHTAPTGVGAQFRVSPPRDMSGLSGVAALTSVGRHL